MSTELATRTVEGQLTRAEDEFPVDRLVAQKAAIQRAMSAVMKENEHYGVIPGTGSKDKPPKPSLFQPGADTLCFLFRLEPEYTVVDKDVRDDLVSYDIRCVLRHIDTGKKWGEGMGSCNSREKRYSSQSSAKVCPHCKKPAIIKGKAEYGGGWLCFKKKDGCGAKFNDGDEAIEQQEGQATAAGVWDLKNTILKMACKRARVAAVLAATAASDCFTQDLEDLVEYLPPPPKEAPRSEPPKDAPIAATTTAAAGASAAKTPSHSGTTSPPGTSDSTATDAGKGIMGLATPPEEDASTLPEEYTENVPCYHPQTGETVRSAPGLTSEQNKKIHALLRELGHHMDESKRGNGTKGTIVQLGKYRKKLREVYHKEHTNELAIHEASWVIEWLLKCVAKLNARAERGLEPEPAPLLIGEKSEDMGPLLTLMDQLMVNGHKSTEAQLAWVNMALTDIGHPRVISPSALTEHQLDRLLLRAQGEVGR